jgi:hypothetical protein
MNWFLLLFFIPLVLVPIVLLCGFAGCAQIADLGSTSDFPPAPSNLIAKTAGASRISLSWKDNSGGTANFVLLRSTFAPDGSGSLSQIGGELVGPFIIDTGLAEGTTFLYQVKAVDADGRQSIDGSNIASATTFRTTQPPTWNTAFEVQLLTITEFFDDNHFDNSCIVQRIDRAHLKFGGTKVQITLRGSMDNNLTIDNVTISPASSIGKLQDSSEDPVDVLMGGSAAVTLPANHPQTLDPTAYPLDPNKDLIIAFNFNEGDGNVLKADLSGCSVLYKKDASDATQRKRSGYKVTENAVFLVEKIEVF